MKDLIYIITRIFILVAIFIIAGYIMSFSFNVFVSSLIDVFLKISNKNFSELDIKDFLLLILLVLIIFGFYKYSKNIKK
jgi:hypothetical protein